MLSTISDWTYTRKPSAYCIKTADGQIVEEGTLQAERAGVAQLGEAAPVAWHGAMEATLFSAWIYDTLKPYAQQLAMGHPAKMKAITAGKKKSDTLDARTIADLLRCNLLPPAMYCRRRCAICDGCCAIATWWCSNRCECRTRWPVC